MVQHIRGPTRLTAAAQRPGGFLRIDTPCRMELLLYCCQMHRRDMIRNALHRLTEAYRHVHSTATGTGILHETKHLISEKEYGGKRKLVTREIQKVQCPRRESNRYMQAIHGGNGMSNKRVSRVK